MAQLSTLPAGFDPIGTMDAARMLGKSTATVRRLILVGTLDYLHVPGTRHGTYLVDRAAVERLATLAAS